MSQIGLKPNELLWYLSRATGIVSIVLLTLVLIAGMLIAGGRRPHGASPTIAMAVHRWVSLGMLVFVLVHISTAIAETFVKIDWISFVIPFTSEYERVWVGLGTTAFDLMMVILVTSYLRHRIPEHRWQLIHLLSYALWALAIVHGFMLGTTKEYLLRYVTLGCGLVGLFVIGWRVNARNRDHRRRSEVAAQEWS